MEEAVRVRCEVCKRWFKNMAGLKIHLWASYPVVLKRAHAQLRDKVTPSHGVER